MSSHKLNRVVAAAPPAISIRPARLTDATVIQAIIEGYAKERLMLPRTLMQIYEQVRDYAVAEEAGQVIGTGALHCYWEDLAEIRSLAVASTHKSQGIGRDIVLHLLDEARQLNISSVFAFTYVPRFFEKFGFQEVPHTSLPLKVWKDCINCSFFNNCNEIAMLRKL
ncbi:MAG: N-acetyltransferase [Acidobacteriia bacterium]|nr:N-acetyltransferase [Terriglobia bacterium]